MEKARKVLEGRAVLKVVDVEPAQPGLTLYFLQVCLTSRAHQSAHRVIQNDISLSPGLQFSLGSATSKSTTLLI